MTKNKVELLDSVKHRELRINNQNYDYVQNKVNLSVVMVNELSSLIHEYPIFITQSQETGQLQLSAILGFDKGENLYLQGEKWQATYLPLDFLRRPFRLYMPEDATSLNGQIAVDFDNPSVQLEQGEKLFDDDGKPTAYLQRIQQTFSQLMAGAKQTREILKIAVDYKLIESLTLNVDLGEKGTKTLSGLYSFDKKALANLSGEKLKRCHKNGVLEVCHLIQSSAIHLEKLIKWKRR